MDVSSEVRHLNFVLGKVVAVTESKSGVGSKPAGHIFFVSSEHALKIPSWMVSLEVQLN